MEVIFFGLVTGAWLGYFYFIIKNRVRK